MKTIGEIVRLSVDHVKKKRGRPRHEVEELIARTLGMRRLDLYLKFDSPLEENEVAQIRSGISRLAFGEPVAYVLGLAPFYGLDFIVSPSVLIPRPETEILVTAAKEFLSSRPPGTIFDLCTGSGCIGLTLKTLFPEWHVVLSDISEAALDVARKNAKRLNLDVEFVLGSLLDPFKGRKAQCIVANPPYLSSFEWENVDLSVASFEPKVALEAGPDGTECYRQLFRNLLDCLSLPAFCAVEIGSSQGLAVLSLARPLGATSLIKDLSGFDRVVTVSIP